MFIYDCMFIKLADFGLFVKFSVLLSFINLFSLLFLYTKGIMASEIFLGVVPVSLNEAKRSYFIKNKYEL